MVARVRKKSPAAKHKKKAAAKHRSNGKAPARKKSSKKAPTKKSQRRAPAPRAASRRPRSRVVCVAYFCVKCIVLFLVVTVVWVGSLRFANPPITSLMLIRHYGDGLPIEKEWQGYEDISPHLLLAILAAEDQRFYDHHGFDVTEIKNALEERSSGRMRGASTLSQQTAKNVFLWPSRSWWRKGAEAYFTVLIEALWSKQRILEVYVNVAEMGPGIYGVESAAREYFDTPASDVTPEQAALLASILPSPLTRDPHEPTAYMRQRQKWILTQMHNLGGVSFLE